jgi:hypothetical protein
MSTKALLITEVTPKAGATQRVAHTWAALTPPKGVTQRVVYEALDGSTVLELCALDNLGVATTLDVWRVLVWDKLGADLASDFRQQLLSFVEAPKDTPHALPATPFVQLRHVEVPPERFADYQAWRERTIFDVVRNASEVEVFLAYHSVISTEPGVMFVSGFSASVEDYTALFNSARYQGIVREAGDQYITGGDRGLYTRIYRRVDPA